MEERMKTRAFTYYFNACKYIILDYFEIFSKKLFLLIILLLDKRRGNI